MAISLKDTKSNISFLTPEQKKQKKMLAVLAAVVLVIMLVIYFGYFKKSSPADLLTKTPDATNVVGGTGESGAILMREAAENLKSRNFIYQDKRFINLRMHGDLPIVVGTTGRDNPFAPF